MRHHGVSGTESARSRSADNGTRSGAPESSRRLASEALVEDSEWEKTLSPHPRFMIRSAGYYLPVAVRLTNEYKNDLPVQIVWCPDHWDEIQPRCRRQVCGTELLAPPCHSNQPIASQDLTAATIDLGLPEASVTATLESQTRHDKRGPSLDQNPDSDRHPALNNPAYHSNGLQRDQQASLALFIVPFVPIRLEIVGVAGGCNDGDEIS
ncbi:hypothetical protein B0H10DRAFT_1941011 [Mycena sp. CBHHK59/15]|nr:hypothetical protein B0H10DRAFT_1941011 [Mycena sp. CBHHK59/15]